MSLTIREIIKFENLKNFKLVAGEGGLDRNVRRTGIVDFEFVQNLVLNRPAVFDEDSFVLSSLLFAHDDSEKLYHAIKVLIEMNVSGLAYKNVIFKELPKDVIELANRENFPIFVFDDSVYFEDLIADLTIAIRQDSKLNVMELKIRELVKQDHSRDDVMSVSERILPNFLKYLTVFLCSAKSKNYQRHIDTAYKNYVLNSQVKNDVAIGQYGRDIVIMTSADHQNKKKYFDKFMDVLVSCGISKIEIYCGASTVKQSRLELDYALREATYALRACKILQTEYLTFSDIGVYQFLLPCEQNSYLQGFANRYLKPLLEEESEQNRKHMETAISYVLNGGQIKETAAQLNIHENTARYRIEKLKEKIDSDVTEYEFYANLNLAIKLYQLKDE